VDTETDCRSFNILFDGAGVNGFCGKWRTRSISEVFDPHSSGHKLQRLDQRTDIYPLGSRYNSRIRDTWTRYQVIYYKHTNQRPWRQLSQARS
jgi:hypothetical protein